MEENEKSLERLRILYDTEHHKTLVTGFVFLFTVVFLSVSIGAVLIFFPLNRSNSDVSVAQSAFALPCPPAGAKPLTPSKISIRVLNGSGISGIADAVNDALIIRGFASIGIGNGDIINDTQILFGKNATVAAYTLAGHFNSPTLVMDDREDGLIDVIVGRSFVDLKDPDLVTTSDASATLQQPSSCVNAEDIAGIPALDHDTTLVPAFANEGDGTTSSETTPDISDGEATTDSGDAPVDSPLAGE